MNVRIAVIGAAAIAAVGVAVWLASGGASGRDTAPAKGPGKTPDRGAAEAPLTATTSRDRPTLHGVAGLTTGTGPRPELATGPAHDFVSESRDPVWAETREGAVKARVDGLLASHPGVRVPKVECRTTRCSLVVVADEQTKLQRFVAVLQEERGFYKRAEQLVLHSYRAASDAKDEWSLGVLLEYAR